MYGYLSTTKFPVFHIRDRPLHPVWSVTARLKFSKFSKIVLENQDFHGCAFYMIFSTVISKVLVA